MNDPFDTGACRNGFCESCVKEFSLNGFGAPFVAGNASCGIDWALRANVGSAKEGPPRLVDCMPFVPDDWSAGAPLKNIPDTVEVSCEPFIALGLRPGSGA